MKTLATIAILAGCTWASLFTYQSASADAYMRAELVRVSAAGSHLRPLHSGGYHNKRRVTDTPKHRAEHNYPWVVSIGDGYLYSAW